MFVNELLGIIDRVKVIRWLLDNGNSDKNWRVAPGKSVGDNWTSMTVKKSTNFAQVYELDEMEKKRDSVLSNVTKGYMSVSTIHGLSYIAEEGRPLLEKYLYIYHTQSTGQLNLLLRLLWTVLCVVGIVVSVLLVLPVYNKWSSTPLTTTVGSTSFPIWNVNFPAVTICSNNKVYTEALQNVLQQETCVQVYEMNLAISDLGLTFRRSELDGGLNSTLAGHVQSLLRKYIFMMQRGSSVFDEISDWEIELINHYGYAIPILMRAVSKL